MTEKELAALCAAITPPDEAARAAAHAHWASLAKPLGGLGGLETTIEDAAALTGSAKGSAGAATSTSGGTPSGTNSSALTDCRLMLCWLNTSPSTATCASTSRSGLRSSFTCTVSNWPPLSSVSRHRPAHTVEGSH